MALLGGVFFGGAKGGRPRIGRTIYVTEKQ